MIHLRNYKLFESVKDISYKEYKSLPNLRESFNEDEKKFIKKLYTSNIRKAFEINGTSFGGGKI